MAEILKVIGLMSGTSLDGIDAALLETDGETVVRPGPSLTVPYDAETRALLRTALDIASDDAPRRGRAGVDCLGRAASDRTACRRR